MTPKPTQLNSVREFKAKAKSKYRIFQRAQLIGEVIIHDENRLFISSLNNISAGGIFVDHLTSIPQGRIVRLVIKSARFSDPVQAKGTVVRVEDKTRRGLAIEFTELSDQARILILECVSETRMETALTKAG